MRVHELAKEFQITSKDIIAKLHTLGIEVKGHMALVDELAVSKLRGSLKSSLISATATKAPAKAKTKAPEKEKTTATAVKAKVKEAELPEVKKTAKVEAVKAPEKPVAPAPPPKEIPKAAPKPVPEAPIIVKIDSRSYSSSRTQDRHYSSAPKKEEVRAVATAPVVEEKKKVVSLRFPITVGGFATEAGLTIPVLIKALMAMGIFANVNQLLNEDIVRSVSKVLNLEIIKSEDEVAQLLEGAGEKDDPKLLKWRPPVVTMMGHVDHGKTSLLDAIRSTNVAATEKGAITQHMGAYGVDIPGKGHVTFLDTPGHEAFSAMRARGANVTDVVVLVVAADDGVMPQTIEAIHHAREAGCPIVVAINKVDLPSANLKKVMGELQRHDLTPESYGGKTICVEVSAKTGKGIPQILEMLLLESEVLDLKANYASEASGTVIESHLSKGSGPVATMIIQRGTLKIGDIVVCGVYFGRVRDMRSDRGKHAAEASPSYAVAVSGLSGVPEAGETFTVVSDEKTARRITEQRALEKRERDLGGASKHLSLENLYERISEGDFKELKLIIKADVQGSMEALEQSLEKTSNDQCQVRVIHSAMGPINESDVMLAAASDAIIIGFHVRADNKAEHIAEKEGVSLRYYNIIYEVIEEVQKAMEGLLEPTYTEVVEGKAEIRKVFQSSKAGSIAGSYVTKGKVTRNTSARVIRNNVIVFVGKITSLKRFKDDARDVAQGFECGIAIEGYKELQEGDIIETYRMDKVATKLN